MWSCLGTPERWQFRAWQDIWHMTVPMAHDSTYVVNKSSNVLFYLYVHKNNRLKRKMTSRKDILSISELVCTKHLKWYCDMLFRSLSALSLTLWHWFWSLVTKLSLRELEPDWGQLLVNQSPHSPDPTLAICWHPPTGRLWISFVRI